MSRSDGIPIMLVSGVHIMMVLCMGTQRSEFAFEGEELIYGIRLGDHDGALVVCEGLRVVLVRRI